MTGYGTAVVGYGGAVTGPAAGDAASAGGVGAAGAVGAPNGGVGWGEPPHDAGPNEPDWGAAGSAPAAPDGGISLLIETAKLEESPKPTTVRIDDQNPQISNISSITRSTSSSGEPGGRSMNLSIASTHACASVSSASVAARSSWSCSI